MTGDIEKVMTAIDYVEDHLSENLDLETVARGLHYSKYYLHRMFRKEAGLTIHDYVQRRKLTEAARLLVFTDQPIMELALMAGYESRQAFTGAFKEMYKQTPNQYREKGEFYPLQLRYGLNKNPQETDQSTFWQQRIVLAKPEDIPDWIQLVRLVIDGFPCLNEEKYKVQLERAIDGKRAFLLKDQDTAVGNMMFCRETGNIDFWGVHPQYRRTKIPEAFLKKVMGEMAGRDVRIKVTTFREGDKADTGYRKMLKELGFAEGGLLVEFGYPTQIFEWPKEGMGA